ncbi:hypothetical protein HYW35_01090 [Candidatus Saccharibacteria bacterium]|nr:hypothetical protein [Candidatus Saccharibacteria bacterium]
MIKNLQKNMNGLAHIQLALLLAAVIAVVGVVGWKVQSNSSTPSTGISKVTQDKCTAAVNDKQFCKFAGAFASVTNYKAAVTAIDKTGQSASYDLAYDSKNNISMVLKLNSQEQANVIVYSGITYSKDYTDGKWFKYASADKNAPQALDLKKEFLKSDFKNDKGEQLTYKNLGTEKCDKLTCYKYQESDPQKPTETDYLWFDTKNYLLRRVSVNDSKAGSNAEMTVTYGSVTISLPSPTKDAPAVAQ